MKFRRQITKRLEKRRRRRKGGRADRMMMEG